MINTLQGEEPKDFTNPTFTSIRPMKKSKISDTLKTGNTIITSRNKASVGRKRRTAILEKKGYCCEEARGLDAGPRLVQKLIGFGDHRTSEIVAKIAEEEVAHVAVGVFWFVTICEKLGRIPCSAFKDIIKEYNVELKGPFNHSAREEAGLPREWYDDASVSNEQNNKLLEVHDRLLSIIAIEKENSSLNT